MPRFLYCDACGFRLVLGNDVLIIPKCEHCGTAKWHTEPPRFILSYNDLKFLRSIRVAPGDTTVQREKA